VRELLGPGGAATIDPGRVWVAGLSAGGAMAGTLAATHPDLFTAVAVHSGIAHGAADGMGAAFKAMATGAPGSALGRFPHPVPAMVVHGDADRTVAPANGERVSAQWMAANGVTGPPAWTREGQVPGGHAFTRERWTDGGGRPLHETLTVHGMGHAWSGGTPGGSYTDPRGPDATGAIVAFFAEATAAAPAAAAGRLAQPK
jgi:poly(3-hydroxybutyrate) depolymerase